MSVALTFSLIHITFLTSGWLIGRLFLDFVYKVSSIIGFALLLYVGISMLVEGIRGGETKRDLSSWKNVILAAVATSLDALAVGGAQSMSGCTFHDFLPLVIMLFIVTFSVIVLSFFGNKLFKAIFGHWAEIIGGIVLIIIGITILL